MAKNPAEPAAIQRYFGLSSPCHHGAAVPTCAFGVAAAGADDGRICPAIFVAGVCDGRVVPVVEEATSRVGLLVPCATTGLLLALFVATICLKGVGIACAGL